VADTREQRKINMIVGRGVRTVACGDNRTEEPSFTQMHRDRGTTEKFAKPRFLDESRGLLGEVAQ